MHEVLQVFSIAQMHRCNIGNFKQFPFLHNCDFVETFSAPSLAHKQMLIKRWLDVNMKRGIDPLCNAMQLVLVFACIAFQLVTLMHGYTNLKVQSTLCYILPILCLYPI